MKFNLEDREKIRFSNGMFMVFQSLNTDVLKLKANYKYAQVFLNNFINYSFVCLLCITGCFFSFNSNAQVTDQEIISKADTSLFSSNHKYGWSTMMTFFKDRGLDSVHFEVVLFINKEIDLKRSQVVGRLKAAQYIPTNNRILETSFGRNKVEVNIDNNGYVSLKLLSGPLLNEQRKIIPLVLYYKK